jgi:hypothetical protein
MITQVSLTLYSADFMKLLWQFRGLTKDVFQEKEFLLATLLQILSCIKN